MTVVDVRDGSRASGRAVTVRGGRITAIEESGRSAGRSGAVDATGKFVVPGYLDLHVHAMVLKDPDGTLALLLAHGITGFRQMSRTPICSRGFARARSGCRRARPPSSPRPGRC